MSLMCCGLLDQDRNISSTVWRTPKLCRPLWGCLGLTGGIAKAGLPKVVKNLPANAGDATDAGLTPGLGRSPGGGHGNPLQDS